MKILNICMNCNFSENYTYQDNLLPRYQHKLGHEVTTLTSIKARNAEGQIYIEEECEKYLSDGVKLIRIKTLGKIADFFGVYPSVGRILRQEKPDFVFLHGLASFLPIQLIHYKKRNKDTILVVDSHQDDRNTKTKGVFFVQLSIFRAFWRYWIHYFTHVYGTTEWRSKFANTAYGIPNEKIDTLLLGIDIDQMETDAEEIRHRLRDKLAIDEKEFVFITGGKLDKNKKVLETMRAFSQIQDMSAKLIVFGPVAEEIEKGFIELLNNDSRIKYIGVLPSSKVYQYFYVADFGVFPGGHSVLWNEANGCGLPCIFSQYSETERQGTDEKGNTIISSNAGENEIELALRKPLEDIVWCDEQRKKWRREKMIFPTIK